MNNEQGFRNFISQGFQTRPEAPQAAKPWQGKHDEIIALWQNLRATPLSIEPVPSSYKGRRFSADGIRITGRGDFVNSVLARLKELLQYEQSPNVALDIDYRELTGRSNKLGAAKREPRYVAYIYATEKKPLEAPKVPKLKT